MSSQEERLNHALDMVLKRVYYYADNYLGDLFLRMGITDGLFGLILDREMGTTHEGIGGEYPSYDGPLTYPLEIRKKTLQILNLRLADKLKSLISALNGVDSAGLEEETNQLKAILVEASEELGVKPKRR